MPTKAKKYKREIPGNTWEIILNEEIILWSVQQEKSVGIAKTVEPPRMVKQ